MATKAYGRMVFWEGASLWVLGTRPGEGPYPKTEFHSHHAVQVTLSLRGWFTLESRDRQVAWRRGGGRAGHGARFRRRRAWWPTCSSIRKDEPGRELQRALFSGETARPDSRAAIGRAPRAPPRRLRVAPPK